MSTFAFVHVLHEGRHIVARVDLGEAGYKPESGPYDDIGKARDVATFRNERIGISLGAARAMVEQAVHLQEQRDLEEFGGFL